MNFSKYFGHALLALALACTPLKKDEPRERCDQLGASRCGAPGPELSVCGDDGYWRSGGRCPGGQVCATETGAVACREPVPECFGKMDGYRFCRENTAHTCSTDWARTTVSECVGDTALCLEGQCTACGPNSRRCENGVPELCSAQGFWEKQAACVAPTSKCVLGHCEPNNKIGMVCRRAGEGSAPIVVEWLETTSASGLAYAVNTIGGGRSASGWRLEYRTGPSYFDSNTAVTDDRILDHIVPRASMPSAGSYMGGGDPPLSILTCPDGTCVASPARGECITVYNHSLSADAPRPPRIAVVGDELLRQNEMCQGPRPQPDFCAPTLAHRLQEHGYASWISYHTVHEPYAWLHVVREKATTRPDVMVIAVANYELQRILAVPLEERPAARTFAEQSVYEAIRAVRALNTAAGIVLVTASERGTPAYHDEAKLLNRMLWKIFEDRTFGGDLFVAGWEFLTVATCGEAWVNEAAPPCNVFDVDQLHLQGAGDELRNDLIIFAIATALKPDN